jgi:hypothetical protein
MGTFGCAYAFYQFFHALKLTPSDGPNEPMTRAHLEIYENYQQSSMIMLLASLVFIIMGKKGLKAHKKDVYCKSVFLLLIFLFLSMCINVNTHQRNALIKGPLK